MPVLVTPGMLTEVRRFFEAALDQTCVVIPNVPVTDLDGPVTDDWGQQLTVAGTPVTGVACKLRVLETVDRDERGALLVRRPTLWVEHDIVIRPGDLITEVKDREGRLLLESAGVVSVEADPNSVGAATQVVGLEGATALPLPAPGAP